MDLYSKKGMDTTFYTLSPHNKTSRMVNIDTKKPYPKLPKCTSGYVEEESFKNATLNAGYFCSNCIYFIKGDNHCAIVQESGPDVNGNESGIIAPYGSCDLWAPNK